MREQIIQLPNNFEVKEIKDGKIILIEKDKKLTYEDVARKLFKDKLSYCIDDIGGFAEIYYDEESCWNYRWNATSKRQLEKLSAINMLMNVAKYFNDGWQPDWNNEEEYKYYIKIKNTNEIVIDYLSIIKCNDIYFKSRELAEKAIEILGEETIRFALCTDY